MIELPEAPATERRMMAGLLQRIDPDASRLVMKAERLLMMAEPPEACSDPPEARSTAERLIMAGLPQAGRFVLIELPRRGCVAGRLMAGPRLRFEPPEACSEAPRLRARLLPPRGSSAALP